MQPIWTFLHNYIFFVVVGIVAATLAGSIGCLLWRLFAVRMARYTAGYDRWILRIILFSFLLPLFLTVAIGNGLRDRMNQSWMNVSMILTMTGLVILWIVIFIGWMLRQYARYRATRYLCMENEPLEEQWIWDLCEKWKNRLGIRRDIGLYYNQNVYSPGIVYYDGEYQLLFPRYTLDENTVNIALLHELVHFKHGDIQTKNLGMVVNALYVFNPAVYYLRSQIDDWSEVSCDWTCCQVGAEEFTRREYFQSILALKEKVMAHKHQSTMYCLFENKKLLNFRVDMMARRKSARPHMSILLISAGTLLFVMLASVLGSVRGVAWWREETLSFEEQDILGGVQRFEENIYFNDYKVSILDNILIDQVKSTDFRVESDEVKLYTIPEDCPDEIVVVIICNQGTKQFGYISEDGEIVQMDGAETASLTLAVKKEKLFFKNTGSEDCQMEVYISGKQ